jgi:hypothetical protein
MIDVAADLMLYFFETRYLKPGICRARLFPIRRACSVILHDNKRLRYWLPLLVTSGGSVI